MLHLMIDNSWHNRALLPIIMLGIVELVKMLAKHDTVLKFATGLLVIKHQIGTIFYQCFTFYSKILHKSLCATGSRIANVAEAKISEGDLRLVKFEFRIDDLKHLLFHEKPCGF